LLAEIHGGECGNHSSSRTLVGKAFRHGFYWPTALQDAAELVRSCKACQFHAKQIHTPAQTLQMIPPSWPFPQAVGGYRFLYVAIDKFTKSPEVTPVVNITKRSAVAFLKSIVCRFGVPNRIIADNGTQFKSRLFQEYCEDIGIQLCFASVAHPRSNGQVERANAEVLRGLKTRTYNCLKKHGARWVDELPCVLWGNRTTPSRATEETPAQIAGGHRTPCHPDPPAQGTSISPRRGPEPPHVRGRGHESSANRLAHPPHLMREAEACSAAAEHGAAFARLHY